MKKSSGIVLLLLILSGSVLMTRAEESFTKNNQLKYRVYQKTDILYQQIDFGSDKPLSREVFQKAYWGYLSLKQARKIPADQDILSVCDFSLSANEKRLWVINLNTKKVLFHSLVAHGQGTGEEYASRFSNKEGSHQSSMGFYITGEPYLGDNGYSLRLHGMDKGYNDNALSRAVVIHGADYVSEHFIRGNKRLGRSWGCPAVPQSLARPIINTIKEGTCLYVYYPSKQYFNSSAWLMNTPDLPAEPEWMLPGKLKKEFQPVNDVTPSATTLNVQQVATNIEQPAARNKAASPQYQGVQLAQPAELY